MNIPCFHHPDISLPVLTRRATAELMDALAWYGEFMLSRGRSVWRNKSYGSETAYRNAVLRLKRQGIVAASHRGGREPLLRVEPPEAADQAVLSPERWWKTRWNGLWYVLVYDVPETNRRYRDHLRRILLLNRCGCLQNSVWVSPRDLRPLFDDLAKAASTDSVAHLFEAKTVLGRGSEQIVRDAWNFDLINGAHARFQSDVDHAMGVLRGGRIPADSLAALAFDEAAAYRKVIEMDPLLPRSLYPPEYRGPESARCHRAFVRWVKRRAAER
jgi:phenylacetic acid degradation operon negative regulatory protein